MRINADGITLWNRLSDFIIRDSSDSSTIEVSLEIGVSPVDARNMVEVHYRVNQSETNTLSAKLTRTDSALKNQYFQAEFPPLNVGDTVDYSVICRCAGRQVPNPYQIGQFSDSFEVSEIAAKARNFSLASTIQTSNPG